MDLMERKALDLSLVQTLVLDEADEMLDMGFRDDLDYILTHAASRRRTWLFSATMPAEIKKMADRFLKDPQTLRSDSESAAPSRLEHWSYQVPFARKYEALKRLIDAHPEMYGRSPGINRKTYPGGLRFGSPSWGPFPSPKGQGHGAF
jgi:ATP-dependent RNA helicase DeaD